jgi:integrase
MQRGQIYRAHGAWHLRYRVGGKQVSRKLADYNDVYRTEKSVRPLADQILSPVNQGLESGGLQTLQQFVESTYLPHAKLHRKPSTYNGYESLYNLRIKPRIGGIRLATFRTLDGQKLLNDVASSDSQLSHQTMRNVKSLLSGVLTFAKRMGAFEGSNPMDGTEVPKGQPSSNTHAYSQKEIDKMIEHLSGAGQLAVTVAAYTGLALGELQGLQWGDINESGLKVQRTIWRGEVTTPKTAARQDELPLLPVVRTALSEYRKANPSTKWVFEGPYAEPYDMATMGSKKIKWELEGSGVKWYGWHALRRGFATRLHEAGVQDRIIQSLMRHSSLSVTMKHYVKASSVANTEAINRLTPLALGADTDVSSDSAPKRKRQAS